MIRAQKDIELAMRPTRNEAEETLEKIFGHKEFKFHQWEVIERIFSNERILLIESTGYGKSLCYQFPALFFEGITLVFSPLIALMRDQVNYLQSKHIMAECINSENSRSENQRIMDLAQANKIKLLFIAPERQESYRWQDLISSVQISMIVIDEAHCISVWGHDFRPTYKKIIGTISKLPNIPILGLTATATETTVEDIAQQMKGDVEIIRGHLNRSNLKLHTVKTSTLEDKLSLMIQIISRVDGVGVVFAGTRAETELIAQVLNYAGIRSVYYHAGIDQRDSIEREVLENKWKCVVATNSFGMGIDKSDFRFIIHTRFPASLIHYYQEIGRAGRDGKYSTIYLLWESSDVKLQEYFISVSKPSLDVYYMIIESITINPDITAYQVSKQLDQPLQVVENVLLDLLDQKIVKPHTNITDLPPNYLLTGTQDADTLQQLFEDQLSSVNPDITSDKITQFFQLLEETPQSDYKLARQIFGQSTTYYRNLVQYMLNIVLSEQENENKDYLTLIERRNRQTLYSLVPDHAPLDEEAISTLERSKMDLLREMIKYLSFAHCRMQYICNYLGDSRVAPCGHCDYCRLEDDSGDIYTKVDLCVYQDFIPVTTKTCGTCNACGVVDAFYGDHIPHIPLVYPSEENLHVEDRKYRVLDGYALTYDFTNLGQSILEMREKQGIFTDDIVSYLVELIENKIQPNQSEFDLLVYIPEIDGQASMKDLAVKLASKLGISISHDLISHLERDLEQEINTWSKRTELLEDAYEFLHPHQLEDTSVLLLDAVYYSKSTMRKLGVYLSKCGAKLIQPVYLVKEFK